jgi:Uma2 family endonuclease
MAMPAEQVQWTVEMLDALPDDGQRYELLDGELFVTPAPSDVHQLAVGALHARLRAYMRPSDVGRAFSSPSDVRRGDRRRNRVQPDVFVVRLVDGKRPAWIANPVARTFARWRGVVDPGELLAARLEWQPAGMPEPFVLSIPEFFEDALG